MKQKVSRAQNRKRQKNVSDWKRICPKALSPKKRFEYEREADEGVPLVRFKSLREKTERAGARSLRWSPATIHNELGGAEGTYELRVLWRKRRCWLNLTLNSEFTESEQQQCQPGVRWNVFGMWGNFLELIFGEVTTQCTWRLPDLSQNFWRRKNMNFTKNDKSGPNLQWAKLENFELWKSGSWWI